MIKINEIKESPCKLYDNKDNLVGDIISTLQLSDVRIQIKKEKVSGYYVIWNDQKIRIDKFGYVESWPKGFFDTYDDQLDELIDWERNKTNAKN
jgi:predicted ATPase